MKLETLLFLAWYEIKTDTYREAKHLAPVHQTLADETKPGFICLRAQDHVLHILHNKATLRDLAEMNTSRDSAFWKQSVNNYNISWDDVKQQMGLGCPESWTYDKRVEVAEKILENQILCTIN